MTGLMDLWLAARKSFAEWRSGRHLALSRDWAATARDCLERMSRRSTP